MTDGITIDQLQRALAAAWGTQDYTADFLADPTPHKRAIHDALHLMGSLGGIAKMLEELGHPRDADASDADIAATRTAYRKFLADMVIVAGNLATECPGGGIALEDAVLWRVETKFPGGRAAVEAVQRTDRTAAHHAASRDR